MFGLKPATRSCSHARARRTCAAANGQSRSGPLPARVALGGFCVSDHEFVDRVTRLEGGGQPTRLLPAARPGFRRLIRISVFGKYPRIRAPLTRRIFCLAVGRFGLAHLLFAAELRQSLFEFALLRRQPDGKDRAYFLVQLPHFIDGHGIEIEFLAHPAAFRCARFGGKLYRRYAVPFQRKCRIQIHREPQLPVDLLTRILKRRRKSGIAIRQFRLAQ